MHYTIFDTPIINNILRFISQTGLKLAGWKLEGQRPEARKLVVIAAPHTSNWDFVYTIAFAFCFRINIFWLGKHSLFKWPFGGVMKWLGGIPVDRTKKNGLVQQLIDRYNMCTDMIIAIPPEATRIKAERWKSGFYHIANGAGVPIALAYLDFKKKVGGFGPVFIPTGHFEKDLAEIKGFYADITGKKPSQFTNKNT